MHYLMYSYVCGPLDFSKLRSKSFSSIFRHFPQQRKFMKYQNKKFGKFITSSHEHQTLHITKFRRPGIEKEVNHRILSISRRLRNHPETLERSSDCSRGQEQLEGLDYAHIIIIEQLGVGSYFLLLKGVLLQKSLRIIA